MTTATPTATMIEFKDIELRTGVRLRYADAGPRDGRPLLLLHGYSDSSFSFRPLLSDPVPNARFIMPDQRGHGESGRPPEGYSLDGFAMDAIALLDGLGIESAVVVGHSLGSFIGQRMAVLAPMRVGRLVLVGSAHTPCNDVVASMKPIVDSLTDPVDVEFVREFQLSTIHRPVPPRFLDRVIAESLKLPARVWKAVLAGLLDPPLPVEPGIIRCPTTLIWGDKDAIFGRSEQEDLRRRIPGAALHVMTDVGHAVHWEATDDFSRYLAAAIR